MSEAPDDDERGLLDTSVVIALAQGAEMALPRWGAISVITLCGLHRGVLAASGEEQARRLAALTAAERQFESLPVDARVAPHYARVVTAARQRGVRRPPVADTLIAATAISHALPLYTRDRDFERLDIPALRIV